MRAWMSRTLKDIIFPRSCAGCGAPVDSDFHYVCWTCLADVQMIAPPFCRRCGDPFEGVLETEGLCSACLRHIPYFDTARSVTRYRGVLQTLLQDFKYRGATWLSPDFGRLLQAGFQAHWKIRDFDVVTFVPLYPAKERGRSYNQARLLAQALRGLALPVRNCLARIFPTRTQTHLTAAERSANVRHAFVVKAPNAIRARRVLVLDDVMTTGATVNECARVLKEAGAAYVGVLTVARG